MKPLSHTTKQWAERHLVRGPLRPLAKGGWHALLVAEAAASRAWPRRDGGVDTAAITAVIKTFQRPAACARLVRSLRRLYPAMRVLVADDSRVPTDFDGATTIRLHFDSGVGAGRQALLDRVETPFLLNLDDDFLLFGGTNLGAALALLEAERELDLVGGKVIDLPLFITHDFAGATIWPTAAPPKIAPGTRLGDAVVLDKVPNFFLARTEAVRAVGWDPRLKRLDHADFFTRARGRIASALLDDFRVLHLRDPFNAAYRAFRDDLAADLALLRATYGA